MTPVSRLIRRSDQRLAAAIMRFAGLRGPGSCFSERARLPVTQAELAEAANPSRNAAGTMLRKLAAEGYVWRPIAGVL